MGLKNNIINHFFHHTPSDDVKHRVWRWLTAHRNDDELETSIHSVWDEADTAPTDEQTLEHYYQDIASKLGFAQRHTPSIVPSKQQRWLRIAAIWLLPLLMLGGALWTYRKATLSQAELAGLSMVQATTLKGETKQIKLPDGSLVWLNAGSVLMYPSKFLAKERDVYLYGEAFFDVKHNDKQPFVVNHRNMRIEDLGTTFNVSAYPDDGKVSVTVETGSVAAHITKAGTSYTLHPADQLTYTPSDGRVSIAKVDARNFSSWRQNEVYLDNITLADVVTKLERIYNVRIHLLNTSLAHQRIRASFDRGETLPNILSIIAALVPGMKYEISGQDVYIR